MADIDTRNTPTSADSGSVDTLNPVRDTSDSELETADPVLGGQDTSTPPALQRQVTGTRHSSLIAQLLPTAGAWIYVLELYSGHGSVSSIASTVLGYCPVESVDAGTKWGVPTIQATLPDDADDLIAQLRQKYPMRRPVVWASPDCSQYSILRSNAESDRDLEGADARVVVVDRIARELNAVVTIVENPATGLLVGRGAINFLPFATEVHYCGYGTLYRKATMLWSSHNLSKFGFRPKTCLGPGKCDAMIVDARTHMWRHVQQVPDVGAGARVSVPPQLAVAVFRAIVRVLRGMEAPRPPPAGAKPHGKLRPRSGACEINLIRGVRRRRGDGTVEVLVDYVGQDCSSWVAVEALRARLEDYDFLTADVQRKCIGYCE